MVAQQFTSNVKPILIIYAVIGNIQVEFRKNKEVYNSIFFELRKSSLAKVALLLCRYEKEEGGR